MPDLVQLARKGDHTEIDRMIVLVLGCAVTCPDRSCHISRILESDNIKMKTEILKQVASLRLEKTFLNLRLAVKISKYDEAYPLRNEEHEQQRLPHVERKWSSDSGIVTDEYNHKHQKNVFTTTLRDTRSGVLETSFDTLEDNGDGIISENCQNNVLNKQDMKDFQCQVNIGCKLKTSEIIDVDDELLDSCETTDISTDPVFDDKILVENLENKIRSLLTDLEDAEEKNVAARLKCEETDKRLKEKCDNTDKIFKKKNDEIQNFQTVLEMTLREKHNTEYCLRQEKLECLETIQKLQSFIEKLKAENLELKVENEELEARHWSLEMMLRKQSFAKSIIMLAAPDAVSTTSSGFISAGLDLPDQSSGSGELQPVMNTARLNKLEAEAERLSDLLGVMEEREEQLLDQVKFQEVAREEAELKVRETEGKLAKKEAADQIGDRMKKVLLLTAAFGAVHQALQNDLVMGSCTML